METFTNPLEDCFHSDEMFRHLEPVRGELNQYFGSAEVFQYTLVQGMLRARACSKGAIPLDRVLSALQNHIVCRLQHADLKFRSAALYLLTKFGEKYDHFQRFGKYGRVRPPTLVLKVNRPIIGAILAALPSLTDTEDELDFDPVPFMALALSTLGVIGDRGNESVISAVAERTQHHELWVRDCAVQALERVATVGDHLAINAALQCIDDEEDTDDEELRGYVRLSTLETLKALAKGTDDADVVTALIDKIEYDSEDNVRLEALETLRQVASEGNGDAIAACIQAIEGDSSEEVRIQAWEVVANLATKGDKLVISACLASLEHENIDVCVAAAELLGKVAPKGHVATVGCLSAGLLSRSGEKDIDTAILHSLSRVALKGNRNAISAIMQFIEASAAHEVQNFKQCPDLYAAFDALRKVASAGDTVVISFTASYLGKQERYQ